MNKRQHKARQHYQKIAEQLWRPDNQGNVPVVYAIFDGARNKSIAEMASKGELKHSCLYEGRLSYKMTQAAPYMVRLEKDHAESYQWIEQGWGNSWGIFMITYPPATLFTVRHNCRKIAVAKGPNGKRLVFRYYDPRVLRTYLPTCNDVEANKVFGPVTEFIVEGESQDIIHRFRRTAEGVRDISRNDDKHEYKPVVVESFIKEEKDKSPLSIRQRQMLEFAKKQMPKFIDEAESYLSDEFPDIYESKKPLQREWLESIYYQAKSYGMITKQDHIKYINYVCIFGEDWLKKYDFCEEILNSSESAKSKLANLKVAFVDHLNRDR